MQIFFHGAFHVFRENDLRGMIALTELPAMLDLCFVGSDIHKENSSYQRVAFLDMQSSRSVNSPSSLCTGRTIHMG